MSFPLIVDVWDNGPKDPTLNSVLLWLAFRSNDQGGNCFPSVAEICAKVRRSERAVRYSIAQLKKDKWITIERGSGRGKVSEYKLNIARLKRCNDCTGAELKGANGAELKGANGAVGHTQRVQPTTLKGATAAKPPHPLKGVKTMKDKEEIPEWLSRESWNGFVEMRQKIKKPLTDHAKDLAIEKLNKFRQDGYEPTAVLDQSTMNNWQGLFIPKGIDGQPVKPTKRKRVGVDPTPENWLLAQIPDEDYQ